MQHLLSLWLCLWLVLSTLAGQSRPLYVDEGCNYAHEDRGGLKEVFEAHDEAKRIVAEILQIMKVPNPGFVLAASGDVQNAFATRDAATGTRYILYNVNFLENFKAASFTQRAAYSVLAHEIAHHVLTHDLESQDNAQRKQEELAADAWAARVLARLGATLDEALAGVRTFDLDGESATHPHPTAREQQIGLAFVQELDRLGKSGNENPPPPNGRHPIELDFSRKNRWNLFTPAFLKNAEIDGEKVTIRYQLPPGYVYRPLLICLSANNDAGIIPGANIADTAVMKGVGSGIFFDPNHNIVVWNFRRQRYTSAVAERAKLQLFIYDQQAPALPQTMGWVGSGLTLATGIGAMIYGQVEIGEGHDIYEVYRSNTNPFATLYTEGQPRGEWLADANDHKVRGDWFFYGGTVVTALGGAWLYDKFRQKRTYNRDVCTSSGRLVWHPTLRPLPHGIALGANLQF